MNTTAATIDTTSALPARFLIAGDIINTLPFPMQVERIEITSAEVGVYLAGTAAHPAHVRTEWYALTDIVQLVHVL